MRYFLVLFLFTSFSNANELFLGSDLHPDRFSRPEYISLAFGTLDDLSHLKNNYPFPFKLKSIGHSIASYQNYSKREPYFHHGIDIIGLPNQEVFSTSGGKIVNIENYYPSAYYWEVAVLDTNGFLWQYHHIKKESIPTNIWEAFNNNSDIKAGTKLGEIIPWPVSSFGEIFHHIHLNVLDSDGNYINPLLLLENLSDDQGPEIIEIGILKNGSPTNRNNVSGDYSLFVNARDLLMHNRYYLPPYLVEYSLDGDEYKAVWKFNSLPGGNDIEAYVHDFYIERKTCGNYSCRKFYIDLGFQTKNTMPKDKGEHNVTVKVQDFYGNSSTDSFSWVVE